MDDVKFVSTRNDEQTKIFTQIVQRLQDSEDRNDKFLQDLLMKSERMEVTKLDVASYGKDCDLLNKRLDDYDKNSRENHTHYIQVENYIEKFLPLKIQK